jgi:hypothetical protein
MSGPIKIWLSAAYLPVFRCGGWASVRVQQGDRSGLAGGDRNTTAGRTALAGLAAALRGLPAGGVVEVATSSAELAGFADVIASLGTPAQAAAPADDLDLWAQILTASAGRRLSLVYALAERGAPTAFTTAWAELARDKAKATGAFTAAIPKPNLAKVEGLAAFPE